MEQCNCGLSLEKSHLKKDGSIIYKSTCRTCRGRKVDKVKQAKYRKSWYSLNKKSENLKSRVWRANNKEVVKMLNIKNKKQRNLYCKNRLKNHINFKLTKYLRTRLYNAIKSNQKVGSAVSDLGCSIGELKKHLESQFESWMNWDNWGPYDPNKDTWHLDHKEALANFDLTNIEELKKVCSYTNLRPYKAIDNILKGSN